MERKQKKGPGGPVHRINRYGMKGSALPVVELVLFWKQSFSVYLLPLTDRLEKKIVKYLSISTYFVINSNFNCFVRVW